MSSKPHKVASLIFLCILGSNMSPCAVTNNCNDHSQRKSNSRRELSAITISPSSRYTNTRGKQQVNNNGSNRTHLVLLLNVFVPQQFLSQPEKGAK